MTRVTRLEDQPRGSKHVTFDSSGKNLTVSCADGNVYVYLLDSEEPELIKKIDGLAKSLNPEAEESSKAFWHPDGRAFVVPTATRGNPRVSLSESVALTSDRRYASCV